MVSVFLGSEALSFSSKAVDKGSFGKKPGGGGAVKVCVWVRPFSQDAELGVRGAPWAVGEISQGRPR